MKALVADAAELSSSWIVDSGASIHLTSDITKLQNKMDTPSVSLEAADGRSVSSTIKGSVDFGTFIIKNVYYFPEIIYNLISVATLKKSGLRTIFDNQRATFQDRRTNETVTVAHLDNLCNLYVLKLPNPLMQKPKVLSSLISKEQMWHRRLGHPSEELTKRMMSEFNLKNNADTYSCIDCAIGKCTRKPRPTSNNETKQPLERIHMDLVASPKTSTRGNNYMLTVVDDYSRFCWIIPLKAKSDAPHHIKSLIEREEKRLDAVVKIVKSDGGKEFVNRQLLDYLESRGIEHEISAAGTPQQNGVAERKNGTILRIARTLLSNSRVPTHLWDYAAETAAYTSNLWLKNNSKVTSYETYFGRKPNLSHLRTFGCKIIIYVPKESRSKFEPTGTIGVFLGYTRTPRNFWVLDTNTKKILISADVRFEEMSFPFKERQLTEDHTEEGIVWTHIPETENQTNAESADRSVKELADRPEFETNKEAEELTGKPTLETKPTSKHTAEAHKTSKFGREIKPVRRYVALSVATNGSNSTRWKEAMAKELEEFDRLKVRRKINRNEVSTPPSIDCRWVLKEKENGSLRARIVVRGFLEQIIQDNTYAPTAFTATLRLALSIAAKLKLHIGQADFSAAFLNAKLDRPIMVKPPPDIDNDHFWILDKAVYGLKIAPKSWFYTISTSLKKQGLKQSLVDQCLFYDDDTLLILYVDDLLIMSKSKEKNKKNTNGTE